ncbi:uncharacterized protein LOC143281758 isoform X2 [Babylonia areolata]
MAVLSLAAALALVMSTPWAVQSQPVADPIFHNVCVDILNQTVDNSIDCYNIDGSFKETDGSTLFARFLLCCLGAFGGTPVRHNYNRHLNVSLTQYIFSEVDRGSVLEMATYIRVCNGTRPHHNLTREDYDYHVSKPTACT